MKKFLILIGFSTVVAFLVGVACKKYYINGFEAGKKEMEPYREYFDHHSSIGAKTLTKDDILRKKEANCQQPIA